MHSPLSSTNQSSDLSQAGPRSHLVVLLGSQFDYQPRYHFDPLTRNSYIYTFRLSFETPDSEDMEVQMDVINELFGVGISFTN